MHKPESVLEKETHKIFGDFAIQADHLIFPRRPDLVIVFKKKNKSKNLPNSVLCRPGGRQNENQRKRKERQVRRPCPRHKKRKVWEHEGDGDTNCNWCAQNNSQRLGKKV